jgi:hypothetical protein
MKASSTFGVYRAVAYVFGFMAVAAHPADLTSPALAFRAGTNGEFTFNTGVLRGKLRGGGKSLGLSSVTHLQSGTVLDRSMGLFSHYRLFTSGRRYGGGVWDMPSTARLRADASVEMVLSNATDRPFQMTAVFRWHDAATLDLETTVKAVQDLPGFEVFLASYFGPQFTNALVFARDPAADSKPSFVAAERSAAYWHMYARDDAAIGFINDGRWVFPPYPVEWTVCGRLIKPIAIRRAPSLKLDAVLMAPEADCFAIATPFQTESHYSMYLSLFGRELPAGATARVRSRLALRPTLSDTEVMQLYESYTRELAREK